MIYLVHIIVYAQILNFFVMNNVTIHRKNSYVMRNALLIFSVKIARKFGTLT